MGDEDVRGFLSFFESSNPLLAGGSVTAVIVGALFALLKLYNYFRKEFREGSLNLNSLNASSQVIQMLRDEVERYHQELSAVREDLRVVVEANAKLRIQNEELMAEIKRARGYDPPINE